MSEVRRGDSRSAGASARRRGPHPGARPVRRSARV